MGCGSCGTGGLPGGCKNNGWCKSGGCGSILDVHDWLSNIYYAEGVTRYPVVEVKFKGTRKEYFRNTANLPVEIGDMIVVEGSTGGYDVGYVALTSPELIKLQLRKYQIDDEALLKRIVRIATESDITKYEDAKAAEYETMMNARKFAINLNLVMKISDVEYQGDRTKATFFYTAEGRVDFRELIKIYAREFKCKVEMRQIGLRQEAGRLGGIGSCGRELCCSTWLTDFNTVPTTAARYQNLFLNPLKLSGQCGRLKCCLNYELDTYMEALEEFPDENVIIKTSKGIAHIEKMDILKRIVWMKYDNDNSKFFPLEVEKVFELLDMNKNGIELTALDEFQAEDELPEVEIGFKDVVGEERLDRFERKGQKKRNKNRPSNRGQRPAAAAPASGGTPAIAEIVEKIVPRQQGQGNGNRPQQGNNRRQGQGGNNNPRGNNGNNNSRGNNNRPNNNNRPDNRNRRDDNNGNNNSSNNNNNPQ